MLTLYRRQVTTISVSLALLFSHYIHGEDTICNSCKCDGGPTGRFTVRCTHMGLTTIPSVSLWPTNTTNLDLSDNALQKLELIEQYDGLRVLNLSRNALSLIEPQYFFRLSGLEVLDLSNNSLVGLHDQTFKFVFTLKSLNVSSNRLRNLPDLIFHDLIHLEQLVLSRNPIRYLKRQWFDNLEKLRVLDVSWIQAHSLDNGVFHGLCSLQIIDMSGNEFRIVPNGGLRSSPSLTTLILNQNPIQKLDSESFQQLNNIEELQINNMTQLESVGARTFTQLKRLRLLCMQFNQRLQYIHAEAITEIVPGARNGSSISVQEVILSHNSLRLLDKSARFWCEIPHLDLQANPWHCSCSITWMTDCNLKQELTSDLTCDSPFDLRDRKIKDLSEEAFKCDPAFSQSLRDQNAQLATVIVGLVVAALAILLIVVVVRQRRIRHWWQSRKRGSGAIYYVKAQTRARDYPYT